MLHPDAPPRVVPNVPAVAHESFDDEVVLIHFPSGRYYRMDDAGRSAWRIIESEGGASVAEVAEALRARFVGPDQVIDASARGFVDQLLEHQLVVIAGPAATVAAPLPVPDPAAPKPAFVAPQLEVYRDLEDLLLLDPIHDIDESGWPHAKD